MRGRVRRLPAAALLLAAALAAACLPGWTTAAGEAEASTGTATPYTIGDAGRGRMAAVRPGQTARYLLVYEDTHLGTVTRQSVEATVAAANGRLLEWHPEIGTALAASEDSAFSPNAVAQDSRLQSVGPTSPIGRTGRLPPNERLPVDLPPVDVSDVDAQRAAAPAWGDSLAKYQWSMGQMNVPEAHAITTGKTSIVVGILDTGADYNHPDLQSNIDVSLSASCIGGVLNRTKSSWKDDNGHGTWCAGAAAAAKNGRGLVGVAPKSKLAIVKSGDAEGYFYPEATVCSFMHAAASGFSVTSNSYFTDPWLFVCKNDPAQNAIFIAVNRAVQYAISKGVVVIAAAGNEATNLNDPKTDSSSPDPGKIIPNRPVDLDCPTLPAELDNVLAVGATGNRSERASYSNYGSKFVRVVAPGGDYGQPTDAAPVGALLGTWPSYYSGDVSQSGAAYKYLQVVATILETARPLPCPKSTVGGAYCVTNSQGITNFYGHGQVDAAAALRAFPSARKPTAKRPTQKQPTRKPTRKPTLKPTQKPTAKKTPQPFCYGGRRWTYSAASKKYTRTSMKC